MKLERILDTKEKNRLLAEFIGYEYYEEGEVKTIYNDKRVTDIIWIPQHDYNQLFWVLDRICEKGYKYLMMDNIFEISLNGKLVVSKQERNIKLSIYEGLVNLINNFKK